MREIRVSFFMTFTILVCLGVVMIYSSSGIYALEVMRNSTHFLVRHLLFLLIGGAMMFWAMTIDYRILRKWAKPLLVMSFVMLVLVLVPGIGRVSSGARRWFSLGLVNFQPSEFVKLALIIYMADLFARKQAVLRSFKNGFLPPMIVAGALCLLVIKQPDMGSTVLIFIITLSMLFVAGGRKSHIGMIFALAIPVAVALVIAAPYRLRRVTAFLDPWNDPQGAGFQLSQSQIALGSGGFFGVGLGKSVQKLFYLPAAHTDFIFSIIGEELGFIGAITVVFLFGLLLWLGTRILKQTTDAFGYLLVFGILAMLSIQVIVNFGVSIGALPTKGLPLPFISYGGSALIFNMTAIGLILNVSRTQDIGG